MKKIILLFLLLVNVVFAEDLLRIETLMPRPSFADLILAIEPAIPENFVAMSRDGEELNLMDGFFWGPKAVLEAFFKDPASLSEPIIGVLIGETAQSQIESPNCGEKMLSSFPTGCENFQDRYLKWGDYPVYTLSTKLSRFFEKSLLIAWVGPNNASDMTIVFRLFFPSTLGGEPTASDLAFWDNFLCNTKELTGKSLMKVYGFDVEEGYTIVNQMNSKLKVIAERRKFDQLVQVVIVPGKGSFTLDALADCTWEDKAAVLVEGVLTTREDNVSLIQGHYFPVCIKEVEEFSINTENDPGLLVYQKSIFSPYQEVTHPADAILRASSKVSSRTVLKG